MPCRPGATPGGGTIAAARPAPGLPAPRLPGKAVVKLLCQPGTPGAFCRGMRLMAIGGFVLGLPDAPASERAFGRPRSGRSAGAFPQARVVALRELAKPFRRGEATMAPHLLGRLEEGMLTLWGRNLLGFRDVAHLPARQARLPARAASDRAPGPTCGPADGPCLAKTYGSEYGRGEGRDGAAVGAIERELCDPNRPSKGRRHRPVAAPLGAGAHRPWIRRGCTTRGGGRS